jgi:heavy metal translocating P-type ATPase
MELQKLNSKTAREKSVTSQPCELCGLPVGRSGIETVVQDTVLHFCCPGCLAVFQILFHKPGGSPGDFRETELFRTCVASGIIPGNTEQKGEFEGAVEASVLDHSASPQGEEGNLVEELQVRIEGMWCSACSWLIETVLREAKGVLEAKVFFLSDFATVKYLPHRTAPEDLLRAISRLGYHPVLEEDHADASKEQQRLLLRLGLSAILTLNIMMISFGLYWGFFQDLGGDAIRYFSYPLLILATPVVFYGGFPIIKRAWAGVHFLSFSMDTLVALGALSAYFYSLAKMNQGSLHLYFDTSAMLVTLVLLGKYVEKGARDRASRGMMMLCNLSVGKVRLLRGQSEVWVSSAKANRGDEFLVRSGERIPLDGSVVLGRADLDESILTGESRPVRKSPGDAVLGGSLVLDGCLRLCVTRVAAESGVSQLLSLMHHALNNQNPIELLADRITRWLVPATICIAAVTVAVLLSLGVSPDEAVLRGLTVLVITCPCALGIATPLAKVAAIGVSRMNGIVVLNSEAFERTKSLDTLIFDKTGTLTEGKFFLTQICANSVESEEALRRVASIETRSDHFLAREIVRKAGELHLDLEEPVRFESFEGLGVSAMIESGEVWAGNRRLMEGRGFAFSSFLDEQAGLQESRGMTVVFFSWDRQVQGFLSFGDVLRAEAKPVIMKLREKGLEVWLVSGDSLFTTRAVAGDLSVEKFVGEALPKDKMDLVRKLQEEGRRVGMVGDGINDAPAMAQADVGMAFGIGVNLFDKASDLLILSQDLRKIPDTFRVSTLTTRIIKENLFFAFLYNVFGIPLAVGGVLNPFLAVLAMFASSLTVIGNTFRISRSLKA